MSSANSLFSRNALLAGGTRLLRMKIAYYSRGRELPLLMWN